MSDLERGYQIYSGKANDLYSTLDPDVYELDHTDRVSAGNGERRDIILGKGEANCAVATACFKLLEEAGIYTHFLSGGTTNSSQFVLKAQMIPLEVIGRFKATGSFCRRYGYPDMMPFKRNPYIEFTFKCDASGDPLITEDAIFEMGILKRREIQEIKKMTQAAGLILQNFFNQFNLELIDFKLEFGKDSAGHIMICDEISPDTCRLIDKCTGKSLDKDLFRKNLPGVEEAYQEIMNRLG